MDHMTNMQTIWNTSHSCPQGRWLKRRCMICGRVKERKQFFELGMGIKARVTAVCLPCATKTISIWQLEDSRRRAQRVTLKSARARNAVRRIRVKRH